MDLDHPADKRVLGRGLFPNWSPAGDRIVFQRARKVGTRWFSIWTMERKAGKAATGGAATGDWTSPKEVAVSENAAVITPAWLPDGEHLLFCTVIDPAADKQVKPREADIWAMHADGTNRMKLTRPTSANLQPVASPEGTVYFVSDRGKGHSDRQSIWAMQARGPFRGQR